MRATTVLRRAGVTVVKVHPERNDVAYEAFYKGLIFRAVRSRSMPTTWRLEQEDPAAGEHEGGISHEESLLGCKRRAEREIAENGFFARRQSAVQP
ncbi:hypothetical protein [Mycobacterium sp. IS-1496]|uniref:hypothetical protein n=1 Tax=Mycobacterium sp. IS-1496 TaxID=1772284 RepID=UPI0015600A81|nr:hypothetical protein [Mycobacterium sp. IS-1496]